jgi:ABC-type Fe3+/spermidine/putrescine transport system ATPase subunit
MAPITLDKATKVYPNGFEAIHQLELDVADGEFMVLVGPSGCGKTMAVRMVAGLEDITDGTLRIGERVVNDVSPKDRDIAMVFQNYALYPHMTVAENIGFALKLRKMPKAEIKKRVSARESLFSRNSRRYAPPPREGWMGLQDLNSYSRPSSPCRAHRRRRFPNRQPSPSSGQRHGWPR